MRITPGTATGSIGAVSLQDGVDSGIKATILDYTNSNPIAVRLTDTSGDYVSAGAGTQYTEGDTDTTITGTALMWEDASDTLRAVSAAKPLPVDITDTTIAVTQSGTWDEVGINDSGNSITVDNAALSVTGGGVEASALRVTIASDSTGVLSVDDNGGNLSIDDGGNVISVDWNGTAPPIGAGTEAAALRVTVATDSTGVLSVDDNGASLTVDNAGLTELAAAINASSQMDVNLAASAVDVMLGTDFSDVLGTASLIIATQADNIANTQDTLATTAFLQVFDGTTWDRAKGDSTDGLLVNLGTNNDVTVTGSLTSAGNVTNAGTFAVQVDGDALTALQLIDDTVYVDDADWTDNTSKHLLIGGVYQSAPHTVTDGDVSPALIDVNGRLIVAATDNGGSLTVDGSVTANAGTGTFIVGDAGAIINLDASGDVQVDVLTMPTTTVTATNLDIRDLTSVSDSVAAVQSGTWNIGTVTTVSALGNSTTGPQKAEDVASADADVGIPSMAVRKATPANTSGTDGDYEFLQMSAGRLWTSSTIDAALPAGTNAIGKLVANSGVDIGDVDILSIAAGDNNIGNVDIASALPAGTNAIGKLVANSGVDIGDVDVTSIIPGTGATNLGKAEDAAHSSGDTGVMLLGIRDDDPVAAVSGTAGDYEPLHTDARGILWSRNVPDTTDLANLGGEHVNKYYTSAGAVTDGIVWSPAAGKRWFVTDIIFNVSAAATVTFEDDLTAGDSAVMKFELAANSGLSHHFKTPLFSGEDAADLIITTSAGNVYCMVCGYEI